MSGTDTAVPSILETLMSHDASEAQAYKDAIALLASYEGEIRLQSA